MTYVRDQSSAELKVHMRSLKIMPGWFDPLADRLWQEVEALQATIAQQAQMIEHLRGGPTPGYTAVDMTTAAAQGFRDGAASKEKIVDALLNHCEDGECHVCSQIICPLSNLLHFHHDGCPSCAQDEPT